MAYKESYDTMEDDTIKRIEALKRQLEVRKIYLDGGTDPNTGKVITGAKNQVKLVLADCIYKSAPESIYSTLGLTEDEKKDEIRKMPIEEQIRILAEYNIDSEILADDQNSTDTATNIYEKDLSDAQKSKDQAKARLKEKAEEIIEELNKTMETNKEIVEKLEKSIEDMKREAEKIREKLSISIAPKKNEPSELEKRLAALEADITISEGRLAEARGILDKCKNQVETTIEEIRDDLSTNYQIELGKSAETNENEQTADNSYRGYENEADNAPKNARATLKEMQGKSDADLTDCLRGKTYQDILGMTQNLGPINRSIVQKRFENLLYNKYRNGTATWSITTPDGATVTLDFEKLMNINKIDKNAREALLRNLDVCTRQYSNLPPEARKEFDSKMEDLKIAMILAESRTGRVGRFFRQFGSKSRYQSLGRALSDVASKQQEREDAVYNKEDSLRKMLHVKTAMPRRNVRVFDARPKDKEWTR